ncbi:transposable element Tcb2 transposase [Trichonephila clavipes]|nr:transposable element Tcb2 transposase [Trichonephila clavipes]
MRVWKQWTDEHRTAQKTGSGRRKVTSARDDRYLLHVAGNDHTASPGSWKPVGLLLQDHDSHIRVRYYAGERCLPECVIERHSDLTPRVMPKVVPFLQGIPEAIFQQDKARPCVEKTVRDFCSAQHMQLLPWPAYLPDMSPIQHAWGLAGRRLTREPRPSASKDELWLCI